MAINALADLAADFPEAVPSHAKVRERPLEELYAILVRHGEPSPASTSARLVLL
jgi:hypothetical protein